jgi:hypothetical protein
MNISHGGKCHSASNSAKKGGEHRGGEVIFGACQALKSCGLKNNASSRSSSSPETQIKKQRSIDSFVDKDNSHRGSTH